MTAAAVGEVLPAQAWEGFTLLQIEQYAAASGDRNPIHTDAAVARSAGLVRCAVHGMAIVGRYEDYICHWRDDAWLVATATRFVNPLLVDEPATITARVVGQTESGPGDFLIRILVRAGDGRIICVSDAQVRVAARD